MRNSRWYLSTWFIGVLFAFWFLVIPLILGIYFIVLQRKDSELKQQEYDQHVKRSILEEVEVDYQQRLALLTQSMEEELNAKETQLQVKKDELNSRLSAVQDRLNQLEIENQKSLHLQFNAKEEDLTKKQAALTSKEKDLQYTHLRNLREVSILSLAHQLKMIAQVKQREQDNELWTRQVQIREEELEQKLQEKQSILDKLERKHIVRTSMLEKEFEELEREQKHRLLVHTLKVEDDIKTLEATVAIREKELEDKISGLQSLILELDRSLQEKLTANERAWRDELILRETAVEAAEKAYESKMAERHCELEKMEAAHKQNIIQLTKAREDELVARENMLTMFEEKVAARENEAKKLEHEIKGAKQSIAILKSQIITLNDELLYQSFGFYETRFDMENSDEYKHFLEKVRDEQKKLVKDKRAVIRNFNYGEIDESIYKKHVKLAIRSFNNECDSVISKVKFNNIEASEKKIRSAFHYINELNSHNYIELAEEYLALKLEEMFLAYEYEQRKQEEREEQRRINEQIREERKAQQELEEQLKILKKEEQHIQNAMKHSSRFSEEKVIELTARLEEIKRQQEDVDYRIKNTKAGYVYVISNIGSFGENVFKIGMTRRLDPMERVRELGGASVPFRYDVHAVIFSDNAPDLEASLHRTFSHRRVNRVNERKEFFKVTLKEIKRVVHQNHNAVIEFTMAAEAQEFRETLLLEKQIDQQIPS
jgi:hypothetical protein